MSSTPCSSTRDACIPTGSRRTMRTSASAARPYRRRRRAGERSIWARTSGSSALPMATPCAGRARKSAPFSSATASIEPMPSVCAAAIRVTIPMSGSAMRQQLRDLAGPVHPHLDDGHDVLRTEPEQDHGQAHTIVQISLGGVHRLRIAHRRRHDGRNGDARGRLPGRARDRDQVSLLVARAPAAAVRARQIAEGDERVLHADDREAARPLDLPLNDRERGAPLPGRSQVRVPVVHLTAQGDEARARVDGAGIRGDGAHGLGSPGDELDPRSRPGSRRR